MAKAGVGKGKKDGGDKSDRQAQTGLIQKAWQVVATALTFQETSQEEPFILYGVNDIPQNMEKEERATLQKTGAVEEKTNGKNRTWKRPQRIRRMEPEKESEVDEAGDSYLKRLLVDPQLKINKGYIEEIFFLPKNKDIIVRDFTISLQEPVKAFAVFMEGLTDRKTINDDVLKPLMLYAGTTEKVDVSTLPEHIKDNVVYGNQVDLHDNYQDIVDKINYGGTAIFIDGCVKCLLVETKGWDRRGIGKPENEAVIRGPHEAFNETLRSNTGLIRKAIRNPHLITEIFKIGVRNRTDVAIMYVENLVNPRLVEEVKRRITSIKVDYVGESGILEQFIEDHPFMAAPQVLSTERPDRVASFILDGKVAIILDGNPNVLIVPVTFFALLHSPEDYYLRMPYANLVRFLRVVALFIALMVPGIYISITNYHQEMIPTDLILSIAASREAVPFPTIIEVILMEFAFELIREAGVRVPGIIGNTLGIVGALILGQAAVQAGIVSPVLIIVVAVTGLASFAIPNYAMSFAFRGVRFIFTALAAVFGFFGISAGLFILLTSMTSTKSFGVPILSPIGPRTKAGPDIVMRGPMWSMEERPDFLDTLDRRRQPQISRGWLKKDNNNKGKGSK